MNQVQWNMFMVMIVCNYNDNFYQISGAAIVVAVFLPIIYFVIQDMDGSSLDIILLVEFGASIGVFDQFTLNSTVHLPHGEIHCYKQVMVYAILDKVNY